MSQSPRVMPYDTSSISLHELNAADVQLRHHEAVAISRELMLRVVHGHLPGVPDAARLLLCSDGSIDVAGTVPPAADVRRAGHLLVDLLSNAEQDASAPATFRLILARAFATDAAAFGSLEELADALAPFARVDSETAVRQVVSRWQAAVEPQAVDWFAHDDSAHIAAVPVSEFSEAPDQDSDREDTSPGSSAPSPDPPVASIEPRPPNPGRRVASTEGRSHARLWVAAAAMAALIAAIVPALWFSRSGRVEDERSTVTREMSPQEAIPPADPTPPTPAASAAAQPRHESSATRPPGPANMTGAVPREPATATRQVLADAAFSPAFASGTSGMFYHSGTGPGSRIMKAETDGDGGVLRVMSVVGDRGSNFHPRPSPDGRSIAFDSDRDGERGVYIADANGRGVRRISGAGFAAVPSWSPDGRKLAFVRSEPRRPRVWNIWTLDVGTGGMTRLTSHRLGQPWGAAWFPDGEHIAYSHEDRLVVQRLDGGGRRIFKSPLRGRLVRTPAVSPDGRRIIFQVFRDGAWMLDLSDDSMYRVLEDPSAEEFTWSPDGRRVAYHSRRSGKWGVWVMAPR